MFANKFFLLFVNFLWMGGLLGVLFALLYMAQYRRRYVWQQGQVAQAPRTLAPLYGAMALFGSGLALHAYTKIGVVGQLVGISLTAVWAVLALFFLYHWIELLIDGIQEGWDTPFIDEDDPTGGRSGLTLGAALVITLLVVNVGLLTWWGEGQMRAGNLDLKQLVTLRGPNPSVIAERTNQASFQPAAHPQAATAEPLRVSEVAAPVAANPTANNSGGFFNTVLSWINGTATAISDQVSAWLGDAPPTPVAVPAIALTPFVTNTPATTTAVPTVSAPTDSTPVAVAGVPAVPLTATMTVTAVTTTAVAATATTTGTVAVTVTVTVTATATATMPPPSPTPTATATAAPTDTPTPAPTPTATATATPLPPATPRPRPTPTIAAGVITPVNPLDNEASNDKLRFAWNANFTPSPDYAFEVIFWDYNQDPMKQGLGMAAPTLKTSVEVDLSALDNRLGDRLEPDTYQWGVLLVRTNPTYQRIRFLGGGWHFTYYR